MNAYLAYYVDCRNIIRKGGGVVDLDTFIRYIKVDAADNADNHDEWRQLFNKLGGGSIHLPNGWEVKKSLITKMKKKSPTVIVADEAIFAIYPYEGECTLAQAKSKAKAMILDAMAKEW